MSHVAPEPRKQECFSGHRSQRCLQGAWCWCCRPAPRFRTFGQLSSRAVRSRSQIYGGGAPGCYTTPRRSFTAVYRRAVRRGLTNRVFRGSRRGGWTAEYAERAAKRGTRGMPTELACNVRRGTPRKAAEGRGRPRKAGVILSAQPGTNGNNALAWCYSPIRDVQQQ